MMGALDTIAAIATPPGTGAIAIVRCSGPQARQIAARVFRTSAPLRNRIATYGRIVDAHGALLDRGLAIAMDAPQSATGEHVVELHVHGSPIVARETLAGLLAAGARLAEPGEFTRRAYENGKLDLSAAEAVADLIGAESRAAVQAAAANLNGGVRRLIREIERALAVVSEELAGAIDFPDEVAAPDPAGLQERIASLTAQLTALVDDSERGRLIREGVGVAIVGPPNAGKSSLLNALVGEERAIVSRFAGTTRDTIEEALVIDGVRVRAIDTAGLRISADPIERIGIDRARSAMATATIALVVVDGSQPLDRESVDVLNQTRARPRVVFFNKRDLGTIGFNARATPEREALSGSVFEEEALHAVRRSIAAAGWGGERIDGARPYLAGARQTQAVLRARDALNAAAQTLSNNAPPDLISGDLLAAAAAIAEVSGGAATEALLDGIFARFCIGK